ncbi:uncharacterized protein PSFLO_01872 [Pseudozyma flocculosa]|uniref:Uncharacterized protein n=1 Tax=Pseudozyma flocculosa TaxID=84751 RepID=A0A5C3EZJ1_9BASI|nr:uncharacterized protein PSFLO_01872 [Pseudozyma flocculosa]
MPLFLSLSTLAASLSLSPRRLHTPSFPPSLSSPPPPRSARGAIDAGRACRNASTLHLRSGERALSAWLPSDAVPSVPPCGFGLATAPPPAEDKVRVHASELLELLGIVETRRPYPALVFRCFSASIVPSSCVDPCCDIPPMAQRSPHTAALLLPLRSDSPTGSTMPALPMSSAPPSPLSHARSNPPSLLSTLVLFPLPLHRRSPFCRLPDRRHPLDSAPSILIRLLFTFLARRHPASMLMPGRGPQTAESALLSSSTFPRIIFIPHRRSRHAPLEPSNSTVATHRFTRGPAPLADPCEAAMIAGLHRWCFQDRGSGFALCW